MSYPRHLQIPLSTLVTIYRDTYRSVANIPNLAIECGRPAKDGRHIVGVMHYKLGGGLVEREGGGGGFLVGRVVNDCIDLE